MTPPRFIAHAASLAPGSTAALMDAARAALIDNDIDEAEPLLRQVLARQPDAASARGHLAHILRARGDFAAAAAELEQAIASRPEFIGLYDDLVQARGGADPALVARMRAASTQHAPLPQRIKLHLALARALDHAGDYAEAAAELQNADALRAIDNPFDRAALARQHDQIVALFTQAYMASPYHHGSPSDLPILIVGMPRSGTTLLEQILASHPAAAGAGEVHFWEAQGPRLPARRRSALRRRPARGRRRLSREIATTPPRGKARRRQDAVQFPLGAADPSGISQRPHHPLPSPSRRHLPLHHVERPGSKPQFLRQARRPAVLLPYLPAPRGTRPAPCCHRRSSSN
ncbi:MAG: sulfotransferase [Rhodospirillales bacterium]